MSAAETGQMSAAETGQMSAVETRQMLKSQIRGCPKSPKCPKMGREPGLENPPTSIARLFPSLWDRSRSPKFGPEPEKFTWYPANEE